MGFEKGKSDSASSIRMKAKLIQFILICGAGCLGVFVYLSQQTSPSPAAKLLEARLLDLAGDSVTINHWNGKIRVINFWATWCSPCLREIPLLIDLQENIQSKRAQVLGIGIDDAAKLRQFAVKYKINYPVLVGGGAGLELSSQLGNVGGGIPYTVVLDESGDIIVKIAGEIDEKKIKLLKSLFEL